MCSIPPPSLHWLSTTYRLRLGNMISEQNGRRVKTGSFWIRTITSSKQLLTVISALPACSTQEIGNGSSDRLENDATGVLDDGVENFIETLSSNMKKWENQTHVREAATNITRILLMYRSEHHIKPKKQSVNNTVHEEFRKLIKNAFKSGLVDPDDLVSNILQQIENDVQNSELEPFGIISNHNRILYGWASLTYLKEHKMHAFNPAATTRMKALNHSYPILNLPSGEMLELHMDSARVQPSSDGPKFALSHEFWKTMSDNNYLNKNWFSGNNTSDFTPPSQRPVYLLKKGSGFDAQGLLAILGMGTVS